LAESHYNLGLILLFQEKWDPADKELLEAQTIYEKLVKEQPDVLAYAVELAATNSSLGNHARFSGQSPAAALKWFDKAIATLEPVLAREPKLATAREHARGAYWSRAEVLNMLRRPGEAVKDYDKAIEFDDGTKQVLLRSDRVVTLVALKEYARAREEADALAASKDLPGMVLGNLALVYAQSAGAAREDADMAERYAARAVELLRRAAAAGFKNVDVLKTYFGFAPLRSYKPFQELLKELEKEKDGRKPNDGANRPS
jgi:tetratricopeptide (TPR) repeat protein